MRLYFASACSHGDRLSGWGVENYLYSYLILRNKKNNKNSIFDHDIKGTKHVLDSGAHTFQQADKPFSFEDMEKFLEEYGQFIEEHNDKFEWFAEMDIDNRVGLPIVDNWRRQLEKISPKILPVWHTYRGVKNFKKLCDNYKDFGVGKVTREKIISRKDLCKLLIYAYKAGCRVHGFGITDPSICYNLPLYSVDSTSWLSAETYGTITIFDKKKMKFVNFYYKDINKFKKYFVKLSDMDMLTDYHSRTKFVVDQYKEFEKSVNKVWKRRGIDWEK